MMMLVNACNLGRRPEIRSGTDNCEGRSVLIFIDSSRRETDMSIANNEYACSECFKYLSNEDQKICEDVE